MPGRFVDYGMRWVTGAFTVGAMWFKYPFALLALVIVVGYMVLITRPDPSPDVDGGGRVGKNTDHIKSLLAFLVGGLVIGLIGIGYMVSLGALDDLVQSAQVTSQYTLVDAQY